MTAKIIDGRAISQEIRAELRGRVDALKQRGVRPGLAFVLVGDNPASLSYVASKNQGAAEVGINSQTFQIPGDRPQEQVVDLVRRLNADSIWHGILVQLPLPPSLSEDAVINAIAVEKDVDGIHPANIGRLLRGEPTFKPATPAGVQQLLLRTGHDPEGKHVVICGRSNIVGKPLAAILMQKAPGANATVTVCHTRTPDLAKMTLQADTLIAAMGAARAITAGMVREGAVVIDVGNNRIEDASRKSGYRLVGDVDYDAVAEKAAAITPVPGGVGPMTVTMLLSNTVLAAEGRFE
ncbi:MAG: tetrahydrofolate dehydrogenase/cyclohydrolase catalytic domain-containing protein [Dehalococcoidia bacterium]|jgi:methylenetetrahydrofolate dehydrogenase (NADP+)/methenyltetrahydrofolate cyclohydrolase